MKENLQPEQDNQEQDEELYEHYRFKADPGQGLLRIDKWLLNKLEHTSRNKIQNAAKAGLIEVNGKAVKPNYKIHPLDEVVINLPTPPREVELIAENIPIEIVYEDDDIIIVNKEAGMVVHPGYNNFTGTLLNALLYHFQQQNPENPTVPYLLHRIDKDTSGLLMAAKNEEAQAFMAKQFFDHSITRRYIALAWGDFEEDEGRIEGHIGRSPKDRKIMYVFPDGSEGKHAVSHYKVLQRFGYVTLVECRLETGRTHQIRAHFQYIKHPLFGDATYGGDMIVKGTTFTRYKQFVQNCFQLLPRQALHARTLGFVHPKSKKAMQFDSELPDDLKAVIDKWEHYVRYQ